MTQPESEKKELDLNGFDPVQIYLNGIDLGSIDLIQGGSFREVIGRAVVTLIARIKSKDGKALFSGCSIILPPATATKLTVDSVSKAISSGFKDLHNYHLKPDELESLDKHIRVINSPTLMVGDIAELISNEGKQRIIAIAEASKYQDPLITLPPAFGVSSVRFSEDLWVPHVTSLCHQCVSAVKLIDGYAVVHVDDLPAERPANVAQLKSVEDCYVVELRYEDDIEELVNRAIPVWISKALSGQLNDAITEIDGLNLPDMERLSLLAQLFSRVNKQQEVLDTLSELQPYFSKLTSKHKIKLANIAYKAGDDIFAGNLLPDSLEDVVDQIWLEEGLEIATLLEDNTGIERFDSRLGTINPNSARLKENRDRRLLLNCRFAATEESPLFTTSGFTKNHLCLMSELSEPQPNYNNSIDKAISWGEDWAELAKICCCLHALHTNQLRYATEVASSIASSETYGRQAVQVVLSSLRKLMLKEEISSGERDYYLTPILSIIQFLSSHPEDNEIRAKFSSLLSVESCGDIGMPIIAFAMLDLLNEGINLIQSEIIPFQSDPNNPPGNETLFDSMANALTWLSEQGSTEFGVTILPAETVGPNADYAVHTIFEMLFQISAQPREDVDINAMEQMVSLLCSMSPHATIHRNNDLRGMRMLAGHCALSGKFQRARDLAEHTLPMGQEDGTRKRLAWFAFADVYHRCRGHVEALIGLACTLATRAPVKKTDLWQEIFLAIRILRDVGLFDIAYQFLPKLKEILSDLGHDPKSDLRIVSIELGLRVMNADDTKHEEIITLLQELSDVCERALNDKNELLSIVILLAQIVSKAEKLGLAVSAKTLDTLRQSKALLGEQTSKLVETVSSISPQASDVVDMYNKTQRSAYSAEIASDQAMVVLAARRLLSNSDKNVKPETQALAIELLAEHSVALFENAPDMQMDWPSYYCQSLNADGIDVAFLALDDAGELVVIHISEGYARVVEQLKHERSFRQRMLTWMEDYPRAYGRLDSASVGNDFFTTMEMLDVALPCPNSLLIIAEPMLQQLTVNLTLSSPKEGGDFDNFLGIKTAIGMAPSLTWLSATKKRVRNTNREYKAWIPSQNSSEATGALDIALSRLGGTLDDFGFSVDTEPRLPRDLSNAALVVVAAHGGLTSTGKYIHRISDEGSLVEAPSALVSALAGVEVVILFVCSGGRIDKHPMDNTTVGLPKQLLNKGSRAVIASPWPLNVLVTYRWLDPFLREWDAGSTILQATKKANESVAKNLGENPQYSLAMTIYGDITLTKQCDA